MLLAVVVGVDSGDKKKISRKGQKLEWFKRVGVCDG